MSSKLAGVIALSAALTPGMANALGLGEISLQSRIGEALMAEVPILYSGTEPPIATCFSTVALHNSDFPVITAAKPRLIRRGQAYILQLRGSKPISEPIFSIALRAGCGHDIERTYVLMPAPPVELAANIPVEPPPAPTTKRERNSLWLAQEGQTLEDMADAQAPNSPPQRQRLLEALKRANPSLDADTPLPEGTLVEAPAKNRRERTEPPLARPGFQEAQPAKPSPPKQPAKTRKKSPTTTASTDNGQDRLLLGAAPEITPPTKQGSSNPSSLAATEERILKLETTLHSLTQELEKMSQAIDLATKAIEAQNRLQLAQNIQSPPAAAPSISAQPPLEHSPSSTNWAELVLSAFIGASVTIGAAQYLSRRRRYPGDDELPLAFSGYRAEVTPHPSAPPQSAHLPSSMPAAMTSNAPKQKEEPEFPVPILPEEIDIPLQPEPDFIESNTEDEDSILQLAEIMVSFGRLHGAADTLADYIEQTMPDCIEPWTMLLDLYRRGGMRQEFEALALKMRNRFNTQVPSWNDSTGGVSPLQALENFPHVIQKISTLWGRQEGMDYLHSLVRDTRAGLRNGFPLEVVEEIALLMRILTEAYDLKRRHR